MSQTDPIADLLTRVRNAVASKHETVDIPHSRIKGEIARLLKQEGFIKEYTTELEGPRKLLRLRLRYGPAAEPVIRGIRRVSRTGRRVYAQADRLPRVQNGIGIALLTTSRGLMTNRQARRAKVGGEVLCYIW